MGKVGPDQWQPDRKPADGLDKLTRKLVKQFQIMNIADFARGRKDYRHGTLAPPELKRGIPPLTTLEYCNGWASAHNESCAPLEKLCIHDFALGYYEGRMNMPEQRLSTSYHTGYQRGQENIKNGTNGNGELPDDEE